MKLGHLKKNFRHFVLDFIPPTLNLSAPMNTELLVIQNFHIKFGLKEDLCCHRQSKYEFLPNLFYHFKKLCKLGLRPKFLLRNIHVLNLASDTS